MSRFQLLDGTPTARDAVVENMEDGVLVLDNEDRVVDMNPAAEEILDRSAPGAIGQHAAEVLSETGHLVEILEKAQERHAEMSVGEEREEKVFDVQISPLIDHLGHFSGRFIVLRDISERKRAEAALQQAKQAAEAANEAKSEFMSVASHEMRTPITCIKGYTDLLAKFMRRWADDTHIEFLDIIRVNADRLAGLVSDLSDMARIESGRLRLELGRVDIEDVIEEAVEALRSRTEEKEQVLRVEVSEDLPPVWGDCNSLVRVTSNLLSNAHKFTPAGGRITVMAEALEEERRETVVHVAVKDNGIGIRPEELEKVFEKFYRSDDRQATDVPGSGLGLSIASNLIEMQGGKIWLESVFREGTTVHFIVPTEREN
jgi:PAS domain S-box-containing protein